MFGAFGVLLPAGGFLAYTGYHRMHVYFQLGGIIFAVLGFGLSAAYVGWSRSFTLTHHLLGLIVMLLALVAQPWAITRGWRRFHHRNGSAVILLGLVNNALGIALLGLRRTFVVMYVFVVALQLVFVVFDPLGMRSARMISVTKAKQEGESTVVELHELLSTRDKTRPAAKKTRRLEQAAARQQGSVTTLRQRRVQPAAGEGEGGISTDDDGDDDGIRSIDDSEPDVELLQTGWRCALRDGGAQAVFTAPTE